MHSLVVPWPPGAAAHTVPHTNTWAVWKAQAAGRGNVDKPVRFVLFLSKHVSLQPGQWCHYHVNLPANVRPLKPRASLLAARPCPRPCCPPSSGCVECCPRAFPCWANSWSCWPSAQTRCECRTTPADWAQTHSACSVWQRPCTSACQHKELASENA